MRACRYYLVIVFALLTTGCELSKYPIDDPAQIKTDKRLIGKWSEKSSKSKDDDVFIISRLNDYKYNILTKTKGQKAYTTCYLSTIDSITFLNVYIEDKDSYGGYIFYRILDINDQKKSMTLTGVNDTNLQYQYSPGEVRRYIKENLNNKAFFKDTLRLYKLP